MKRNVLIFGLVLGVILTANLLYMTNLCYTNPEFKSNDVLGYAAMVVMFSLIFFGVRNYRNNELGGIISFGTALKTGTLIALTAATMYVVFWMFYYYLIVPDFLDKYIPHVLKEAASNGSSEQQLADKSIEMANFKKMYQNPLFIILVTYAEVFPVGFIVAIVSALILKQKTNNEPATGR